MIFVAPGAVICIGTKMGSSVVVVVVVVVICENEELWDWPEELRCATFSDVSEVSGRSPEWWYTMRSLATRGGGDGARGIRS